MLPSLTLVALMVVVMMLFPIGIITYYTVLSKHLRNRDDCAFKLTTYINLFGLFWTSK